MNLYRNSVAKPKKEKSFQHSLCNHHFLHFYCVCSWLEIRRKFPKECEKISLWQSRNCDQELSSSFVIAIIIKTQDEKNKIDDFTVHRLSRWHKLTHKANEGKASVKIFNDLIPRKLLPFSTLSFVCRRDVISSTRSNFLSVPQDFMCGNTRVNALLWMISRFTRNRWNSLKKSQIINIYT